MTDRPGLPTDTGKPAWDTPRLRRLGTVRDIMQPGLALQQGAAGKGIPVAS